MKAYKELSKEELLTLKEDLNKEYEEVKAKGLKLDMSRGKPAASQLDMEMEFMDVLNSGSVLKTEAGVDCRNYGILDGIPEARKLMGDMLGTSVGATTSAEAFLNVDTLKIVALGLIAFAFGTAAGVLFGKLMCIATHGKVNPLIGSAGVSAVPMAARVSQKVGAEADPTNFLLMHAMGPNVAGVIGTAVAAGTFMAVFGVF